MPATVNRLSAALFLTFTCCIGNAQTGTAPVLPTEIEVRPDTSLFGLREAMEKAEREAYDVFNKFNDEARFRISCQDDVRTGSHLSRQVCQPAFVISANQDHARGLVESYRALLDPSSSEMNVNFVHGNREMEISRQQEDYRAKMRSIAETEAEFLDALVRYSELQTRYLNARQAAKE